MGDLKVCIIGAGFSGLCSAIKLKEKLGLSCEIFEKNEDVGGTWLTNRYPGCSCDVQSHLYSLSFEQNSNWSNTYSRQPEILKYLQNVTKKHDLYNKISFNTEVKHLTWKEESKMWTVIIYDSLKKTETKRTFDIVINATGVLRDPKFPKEFDSFKGKKIHTGVWDENVNLKGKVVGVIGTGATGTQLISEIQKEVAELHVFQRSPPWVAPRTQLNIPKFFQFLFAYIPFLLIIFRFLVYLSYEINYLALSRNGIAQWIYKIFLNFNRNFQLSGKNELKQQLKPSYELGCKRTVLSSTFYKTLIKRNVTLYTEKINEIHDNFIELDNGREVKLEILILCTGYNVQNFFAPMNITGEHGINVLELWQKDRPYNYFGIMSKVMPNLFSLLGPYTFLGHNSMIFMIECQVNFIIDVLKEMRTRKAKRVAVKLSAEREFMERLDMKLMGSTWRSGNCNSWYFNQNGVSITNWPFSTIKYWIKTRKADFNDIEFEPMELIV